jgi:hypothetical protein
MRKGATAAVATGMWLAAAAAHAQATFQPNWAGWGSANLGMNTLAHQQAELRGRRPSAAPGFGRPVETRYRRDPAVTRRVVDSFTDYLAQVDGPAEAKSIHDQLTRLDVEQSWAGLVRSDGFRPGDAGDSLAAYWLLNWIMANRSDAQNANTAGVRAQVRAQLPRSPAFARLSEAQRQTMAETYMVNFIYQESAYNGALHRRDQARLQRLSDAAQERFRKEMGVDLRRMDLTDHGFVQRG